MWDHRIVVGISVLGDIEVLLHHPPPVGKKRPVCANSRAKFVRLSDVVSADRDQPAVADLRLALKLYQPFVRPPVLWTIPAAAEHSDHRIVLLQFGKPPPFPRVIGKLIV